MVDKRKAHVAAVFAACMGLFVYLQTHKPALIRLPACLRRRFVHLSFVFTCFRRQTHMA